MKCQYCGISCPNLLILNTHVIFAHLYIWDENKERPDNDWDGSVDDEDIYKDPIV